MSPFDQTAKSITKLRRDASAGKIDPGEAAAKIRALEKKGPRWVARWTLANGREATRVCKSEKEARATEARMAAKVAAGDVSETSHLRAKVSEVLAFYLQNKLAGKGSFTSARAHLTRAAEHIGHLRLDKVNARADEILHGYLFDTAAEAYPSRKTLWNHKVYLAAAFAFWIRRKRLLIVNPWNVVDFPNPGSRRTTTPSFADYTKILAEASKPGVEPWVRVVFILAWEHGRRGGEIHTLDWSNIHLSPGAEDLPWARFTTLKQGGEAFDDVPLYADSAAALRGLWSRQKAGRVFPWKRKAHDLHIRAVLDAAGFPDLWLHDFRRAWNNRHREIGTENRKAMSGHRTDAMDERYWTERRKSLESVVAGSYVMSGDPREIAAGTFAIASNSSVNPRRGRDSNPAQAAAQKDSDRRIEPKNRKEPGGTRPKLDAKSNQKSRLSHASREIVREIGPTPDRMEG